MNTLLIDVDSKIPNLALMKLSTFYKEKGHNVTLKRLGVSYYTNIKKLKKISIEGVNEYDNVLCSIIFTPNANCIISDHPYTSYGGTGINCYNKLPEYIENLKPDYSIYPDNDTAYGFITRGCIRNCSFCVVPKKEGGIHRVSDVKDIIGTFKKVKFLDNNILAYEKHEDILTELSYLQVPCQFNQGLDIRLLTEKKANLLSRLKYIGEYYFAFDNIKDERIITEKLNLFKEYVPRDWKTKFFIYVNTNTMPLKDIIKRVAWCKTHKVLPYFMRDVSCWGEEKYNDLMIDLAAYCNQPHVFKKMDFINFLDKRHTNKDRRDMSIKLFRGATTN